MILVDHEYLGQNWQLAGNGNSCQVGRKALAIMGGWLNKGVRIILV